MIFEEYENCFGQKTYNIKIDYGEDINEFDVAESFRRQFPNKLCVISFTRAVTIECGIILIGLKIK